MKLNFVLGNPPYQDETLGDNKGFAPPIYDKFMEGAYAIADKVELIHPARFLFNAGSTPKAWNQKMLNDPHFKVLMYEEDASKIFPNTDIKGGVAITYRDANAEFGGIGIFTPYRELNAILQKTAHAWESASVERIGVSGYSYHFTEALHTEHPELKKTKIMVGGKEQPLLSEGHEYDLKSNIITKLPSVFHREIPDDAKEYVAIIGRDGNERVTRYIERRFLTSVINLDKYKLVIPKASGVGAFGEVLGPSIVVEPGTGHTETFFSIGSFDSLPEAENLYKYLKTKFARALLSVSKKTQNITPGNFKYIPLQDFSSDSDINWNTSIANIDRQLYKKYGLSPEEIAFIETHVKEME